MCRVTLEGGGKGGNGFGVSGRVFRNGGAGLGGFVMGCVECGKEGCVDALEGCELLCRVHLQASVEVVEKVLEGGIGVLEVVCGPGCRQG